MIPWTHLWNSPGQNTGVGSLSLLQGLFPTQGWNPGLPHCRWSLYQLNYQERQTGRSGTSPPGASWRGMAERKCGDTGGGRGGQTGLHSEPGVLLSGSLRLRLTTMTPCLCIFRQEGGADMGEEESGDEANRGKLKQLRIRASSFKERQSY